MRRFRNVIIVLLIVGLTCIASIEAYRLYQLHRANNLLQILRAQSTSGKFADADFSAFEIEQKAFDSYGSDTTYLVSSIPRGWIRDDDLQRLWLFRMWTVSVAVRRDTSGRVSGTTLEVVEDRARFQNEVILHYVRHDENPSRQRGCGEGGAVAETIHPGLFYLKHPWYPIIYTSLLYTAPATSKDEAYRLSLTCLEHPRGCKSVDEIDPAAAGRLQQDSDWEKNHKSELQRWNLEHCGRPDYYLGWK